jgi:hypothetical protein
MTSRRRQMRVGSITQGQFTQQICKMTTRYVPPGEQMSSSSFRTEIDQIHALGIYRRTSKGARACGVMQEVILAT